MENVSMVTALDEGALQCELQGRWQMIDAHDAGA